MQIEVVGELWGVNLSPTGERIGEIIHVASSTAPNGPAENAFVYAETGPGGDARLRYTSWVNYFDIEHAGRQQPGRWTTVEPPEPCVRRLRWHPFGWGGAILPNVAYRSDTPDQQ